MILIISGSDLGYVGFYGSRSGGALHHVDV